MLRKISEKEWSAIKSGLMKTMKPVKKFRLAAALLAAILFTASMSVSAAPAKVAVAIDGNFYNGNTVLFPGTTYVALREFANNFDDARVTWESDTKTAVVQTGSLTLRARQNSSYIEANGRYLWCNYGVYIENGRTYVPLRVVAAAFGYETDWNGATRTASLTRTRYAIKSGDEFYPADDLYWLSRIISAEALGESFIGKVAVGTVIMNRIESKDFPNSVYSVIFDSKNGVQFTPTINGAIYNSPDADSIIAAKICLEGYRISNDILFFMNEELAESLWIANNCKFVMTVGSHDFYA